MYSTFMFSYIGYHLFIDNILNFILIPYLGTVSEQNFFKTTFLKIRLIINNFISIDLNTYKLTKLFQYQQQQNEFHRHHNQPFGIDVCFSFFTIKPNVTEHIFSISVS